MRLSKQKEQSLKQYAVGLVGREFDICVSAKSKSEAVNKARRISSLSRVKGLKAVQVDGILPEGYVIL